MLVENFIVVLISILFTTIALTIFYFATKHQIDSLPLFIPTISGISFVFCLLWLIIALVGQSKNEYTASRTYDIKDSEIGRITTQYVLVENEIIPLSNVKGARWGYVDSADWAVKQFKRVDNVLGIYFNNSVKYELVPIVTIGEIPGSPRPSVPPDPPPPEMPCRCKDTKPTKCTCSPKCHCHQIRIPAV